MAATEQFSSNTNTIKQSFIQLLHFFQSKRHFLKYFLFILRVSAYLYIIKNFITLLI